VYDCLSYDIIRFKIEVGIEEKCMYKNVTLNTCKIAAVATASLRRHYHDLDLRALSINDLALVSKYTTACRAMVELEPNYHRNQWGLCDALFSNYFEDLFCYYLFFW